MRPLAFRPVALAALLLASGEPVAAQTVTMLAPVEVVGVAPLPGLGVSRDQIAANVQIAKASDLDRRQAFDLADFMNRALGSVNINALQGNPMQPDVSFRGFTASRWAARSPSRPRTA
ncbi:MAG: hypothetical protein HY021_04195 [Burkholderiales bacterium]|nr:hypothetical protein [Burkholderiales bacterium]